MLAFSGLWKSSPLPSQQEAQGLLGERGAGAGEERRRLHLLEGWLSAALLSGLGPGAATRQTIMALPVNEKAGAPADPDR